MRLLKTSLLTLSAIAFAASASAQIKDFGEGEGFTIGLGVIANWSPYDGADSPSTTPIPYIAYDWKNAHLGVDGFSYDFLSNDTFEVSAIVEPRWSFGDPEDSPLFTDIQRDTAIEAGLEAEYRMGLFTLEGSVLHDISDVHNGLEATIGAGFEAELGPLEVEAGVGYAYRDKDLSLHLYGVRADEARAGLAAFTPDATWSPYISAQALYPISDSMGLLAFARFEHLEKDITDSPLISYDRDATIGFAILKRF